MQRTLRIALYLTLILATFPAAAAGAERTLRAELPASEPFAVENLAGILRILPGDADTVVVVASVHAETADLADQVRLERVAASSGRLTYRVRYPYDEVKTFRFPGDGGSGDAGRSSGWMGVSNASSRYDGKDVQVSSSRGTLLYANLEIRVPRRKVDGRFRNVVGGIDAKGIAGILDFDAGSGPVRIEELDGDVRADTGSGDVDARNLRGAFRADTGSGEVRVAGSDGGTLACDVGSGDVVIETANATSIAVDTGSGDVRAAAIAAESFDADTGSGDVSLVADGTRLAKISVDTGSGDVTLRLGPAASFEARAWQGSGDLVNGYADARPIVKGRYVIGYARGDARTQIRVSTGSGDVILQPGN